MNEKKRNKITNEYSKKEKEKLSFYSEQNKKMNEIYGGMMENKENMQYTGDNRRRESGIGSGIGFKDNNYNYNYSLREKKGKKKGSIWFVELMKERSSNKKLYICLFIYLFIRLFVYSYIYLFISNFFY